ncbi:hypothetical protein ACT3UQ_17215 [Glutamicibacter sp. AOP12-B1-11]|uniref:hypothetical protein n=1 Tax=Micrococcaceae TaxID=1268 RepID=UPI0015E2FA17|nr:MULTISPECIES: hypothetical protein [unclassified Arthrobacter]
MPSPGTPDHANTPDSGAKRLRNPKSPPAAAEERTAKQQRAATTAAKLAEVKRA